MTKKPPIPRTKWSTPQLQAHIRKESLQTEKVIFLTHVTVQMNKRKITKDMVFEALRRGCIRLSPELDTFTGDIKCRMEHYVAGHNVKIVVAISDENPNLFLVTAI